MMEGSVYLDRRKGRTKHSPNRLLLSSKLVARSFHIALKRAQFSNPHPRPPQAQVKQNFDSALLSKIVGKTYVVFVGRKPGVYETWEEAHSQVNKFSGASHKSFRSKDEVSKAFHAYIEKQHTSASFTSDRESSSVTFSTASNRTTQSEKLVKLKDLLLDLENENRNHVSRVAGIAEENKQLVNSLEISGGD